MAVTALASGALTPASGFLRDTVFRVPRPLSYDPVEASRAWWIEEGWKDEALGMAAVVSVMRAEQIFLANRYAIVRRPLPARLEMWSVVLGVGITAAVGLFFGAYPASRAASLDPIEALRRE